MISFKEVGTSRSTHGGFTLPEVMVAIALAGLAMLTCYSAFANGVRWMQMAREDARATQILIQKAETLRMCRWDQVITNGFVPLNFTAEYDPDGENPGTIYNGTITIAPAPALGRYSNDLREVIIRVNWMNGTLPRQREVKTYVARYGLLTYVD